MYAICQVIDESGDLNDDQKIDKFSILIDKWENRGGSYIVNDLDSEDATKQLAAIELGLRHEDNFVRQMAVETALKNESTAIQSLALLAIFSDKESVGGYVCAAEENPSHGICSISFSIVLQDTKERGNGLALSGHLSGGIFGPFITKDVMAGTLVGRTLSFGGDQCSLNATLSDSAMMIGRISCPWASWNYTAKGGGRGATAPIVLNIY